MCDGLRSVNRDADLRFALRNARYQLDDLARADYEQLPPRRLKVPADGRVAAPEHIVPGSLAIKDESGKPVQAQAQNGVLDVGRSRPGSQVIKR